MSSHGFFFSIQLGIYAKRSSSDSFCLQHRLQRFLGHDQDLERREDQRIVSTY